MTAVRLEVTEPAVSRLAGDEVLGESNEARLKTLARTTGLNPDSVWRAAEILA